MKALHILDLCGCEIRMIPNSICDMKSLKALILENCHRLEYVPYLGNLQELKELNLSKTAIREVPRGVEELLNLRFLSMDAPQLKILPRRLLLKLVHLQHVYFPLDMQVPVEEIENLKQLEEFGGGVKNVDDFNHFVATRVCDTFYSAGVGLLDTCHYRLMRDLDCCKNEFFLFGWNFKAGKILGQHIVYLTIMKCKGLSVCFVDDLSQLNNPTSLVRLQVESCGNVEYISRSGEELLSTLEELFLEDLNNLKGLVLIWEIGAAPTQPALFSFLRLLKIGKCNKMRKVGLPGLGVPNLEEITIFRCGEIEEIFEDEGGGPLSLPKLKQLNLYELPKLKSVCKETMICKSMEIMEIFKCPRIRKKLPVEVLPPIKIFVEREWWQSLEWNNSHLPQLLHPFLHFQRWT
ncbi:probable disease resistance protein At4g27220 [Salvia hispanica]|uniref:probable disease resistance protein At4g27220 n=1 Tax=Salvia hispanica TaxID=49212 RepID=UPI002009A256|nr:probable disease resistance protein At4g27220 [Salvia hispanica]